MVRTVLTTLRKMPLWQQMQIKRPTQSETVMIRTAAFEYKFGTDVDKCYSFKGMSCDSCTFEGFEETPRVDTIQCQVCGADVCKLHLFVCVPCRLVSCRYHEFLRPHDCKEHRRLKHIRHRTAFIHIAEAKGMILKRTWKEKNKLWKRLRRSFCQTFLYNLKAAEFRVVVTSSRQVSLNECGDIMDESRKSKMSHAKLKGKVS